MIIHTQRLILRPVNAGDLDDLFEYSSQADVGRNAGWKPHTTRQETQDLIDGVLLGNDAVLAIVYAGANKVIGTIGLVPDPKRQNQNARMMGYAMNQDYWGHGLMTEAVSALLRACFSSQGITLVSAYCYPENNRSKAVLRKSGFHWEGRLSQCELCYDGQIRDNDCFAVTGEGYTRRKSSDSNRQSS
ncbi:MAG: GNAT family N-acetyltransferase [Eubacteriaceae bacterium]|jgi:RimJ/RimL family protein N-acetyltransferase|nr:GNAT family N-acetyltransferase [Eubacteriaceae bacterium]MDD4507344.1 GNAT family N-acetyltransferase [Eubacteriaceae bacterium]